ncbi:response regulator [Halonotius aquaticus]|jgi:CheY-like chemotaxis protein|uniref:Response regulator n=1 Tax=Halonotius aquaticus TaxID=2216978 RepID=A0A3A6PL71_9EURY|nr:response regulator [Halonotius aquaticus]
MSSDAHPGWHGVNIDKPVEILLAEDNPGDVMLTRKALEQGKLANNLHVTTDGVDALEFLRQDGEYEDAPRPDLILLDLNMPRKDGQEVLEELRADDELRRIPVVVLTSSESEEDIVRSYELNANAYLTKPVDFDGFVEIVNRLENFWFQVVKFPEK